MIKLIILEGARGGGKSSIAQRLRQTLTSSTLINMTGFKEDDVDGHEKIVDYYDAFIQYVRELAHSNYEYTFILDRTFISEQVYSGLYKSYSFEKDFERLLFNLLSLPVQISYFHLIYEPHEIPARMHRNKTDYFANFEAVQQIRDQMDGYDRVFDFIDEFRKERGYTDKLFMHTINTSGYDIEHNTRRVAELCQ
jgi:thymidylate kinase